MHEHEAWVVRPTGEALPSDPVRVLDGAVFTLASPAEVRRPRFLAASGERRSGLMGTNLTRSAKG
jgi:hypothetical protein